MTEAALRLRAVAKRYGSRVALDGLDLTVPRGAVLGLVGPNGAGKTTAFGIIGGLVRADSGEIDVLGRGPFDPARHRGRVGLLPQDSELNPHTPVRALLLFFAMLQGMATAVAAREVDRLLEVLRLTDRGGARVRELSHGMRRRVAVAQALLGSPELVLLDEPTSGLDPGLVIDMRELLKSQRGRRTLVVSSHVLSDLEAISDELAFLEAGRCVRAGAAARLLRRDRLVRIRLASADLDPQAIHAIGEAAGVAITIAGAMLEVTPLDETEPAATNARVLPALLAAGFGVVEVRVGESLEDAYLSGGGT